MDFSLVLMRAMMYGCTHDVWFYNNPMFIYIYRFALNIVERSHVLNYLWLDRKKYLLQGRFHDVNLNTVIATMIC